MGVFPLALHDTVQGVANRDIKLENTLLDSTTRPLIKICDFGYSKVELHPCSSVNTHVHTHVYIHPQTHIQTHVHTHVHLSCELDSSYKLTMHAGLHRPFAAACRVSRGVLPNKLPDLFLVHS